MVTRRATSSHSPETASCTCSSTFAPALAEPVQRTRAVAPAPVAESGTATATAEHPAEPARLVRGKALVFWDPKVPGKKLDAIDTDQITPAADWLVNNFHVVEDQMRDIRTLLPERFFARLPRLDAGPFAGLPRVYGIAWAFVAHTDSRFDSDLLLRFVAAYQTVQPLQLAELWATPTVLRIVMIENARRLAVRIVASMVLKTAPMLCVRRSRKASEPALKFCSEASSITALVSPSNSTGSTTTLTRCA